MGDAIMSLDVAPFFSMMDLCSIQITMKCASSISLYDVYVMLPNTVKPVFRCLHWDKNKVALSKDPTSTFAEIIISHRFE
jgi:hypothetical protein